MIKHRDHIPEAPAYVPTPHCSNENCDSQYEGRRVKIFESTGRCKECTVLHLEDLTYGVEEKGSKRVAKVKEEIESLFNSMKAHGELIPFISQFEEVAPILLDNKLSFLKKKEIPDFLEALLEIL